MAMADRKGSRPADYDVGYGRPPKATQFRPGQSGNPKGRPKGSRSLAATLKKVTERKVPVTENGKTSWISADEVVLLQLLRNAMRGDSSAIKLLFPLIDRYRDSPAAPNAKNPHPRTVIILPSNGREIEQEPDDEEAGARQRRRRPR
jgi:Family of unknown function (DUF5681)